MPEKETHERLTALEVIQTQHGEKLKSGAKTIAELRELMVTQARFEVTNSGLIQQLTIDTSEVVGAMKTAKSLRKFFMWFAPLGAVVIYFQEHWKDWVS